MSSGLSDQHVLVGDDGALAVHDGRPRVALALERARQLDGLDAGAERLGERGLHHVLDALLKTIEDSHTWNRNLRGSYRLCASLVGGLRVAPGGDDDPCPVGRFLSVDPVDGGSASVYDYCGADPVNCTDLAGTWSFKSVMKVVAEVASVASIIPGPIGMAAAGGSGRSGGRFWNWTFPGTVSTLAIVNSAEAASMLARILADDGVRAVWQKDNVAHVILESANDRRRFAVVSTPGDRWFEVAVNGEFGYIRFMEDVEPDEVERLLRTLVGIGKSYVEHGGTLVGARRFSPKLVVVSDGVDYELHRSVVSDVSKATYRWLRPVREVLYASRGLHRWWHDRFGRRLFYTPQQWVDAQFDDVARNGGAGCDIDLFPHRKGAELTGNFALRAALEVQEHLRSRDLAADVWLRINMGLVAEPQPEVGDLATWFERVSPVPEPHGVHMVRPGTELVADYPFIFQRELTDAERAAIALLCRRAGPSLPSMSGSSRSMTTLETRPLDCCWASISFSSPLPPEKRDEADARGDALCGSPR